MGQTMGRSAATLEIRDHAHALRVLLDRLAGSLGKIEAVGHRVVHGGDQYVESTLITEQVEAGIDALSELAPLHNPSCLAGIRGARAAFGPMLPMVAVFDTAFHQTMPDVARQYALPLSWPSGIGSAAMVFTGLRMPRSRTGTRPIRGIHWNRCV